MCAPEAVGDSELLKQRLGLEIGDPDRSRFVLPHGPVLGNLDHGVAPGDTDIHERDHVIVICEQGFVTEPPEVENIREIWKHFVSEEGRAGVNLSSGLTRFAFPGYSAHAAMKGGVEVLSRYMAKELAPRKIAVNVVAPGAIETDFGGGAVRDNKELNAMIASQTALGRVGLPDDIGGAIALLLEAENSWINAQRIEISGGMAL
jgi:NAD(P)-dependent dehydrogenase (short-subunit alcohol dehydrogenase family)